jgi:cell division FtsZ-interacting protein ZapD
MSTKKDMSDDQVARLQHMIRELRDEVNVMSVDTDDVAMELVKEITYQHRTLQQSLVTVFAEVLNAYGRMAASDGRNEAAVQLAKDVGNILDEKGWLNYKGSVSLPFV